VTFFPTLSLPKCCDDLLLLKQIMIEYTTYILQSPVQSDFKVHQAQTFSYFKRNFLCGTMENILMIRN